MYELGQRWEIKDRVGKARLRTVCVTMVWVWYGITKPNQTPNPSHGERPDAARIAQDLSLNDDDTYDSR
jgi:hypothetical protein